MSRLLYLREFSVTFWCFQRFFGNFYLPHALLQWRFPFSSSWLSLIHIKFIKLIKNNVERKDSRCREWLTDKCKIRYRNRRIRLNNAYKHLKATNGDNVAKSSAQRRDKAQNKPYSERNTKLLPVILVSGFSGRGRDKLSWETWVSNFELGHKEGCFGDRFWTGWFRTTGF